MFGMITSLTKAAVAVAVQTPIAIASDVITLGGQLTDRDQPYTVDALSNVMKNVEDAVSPNKDK